MTTYLRASVFHINLKRVKREKHLTTEKDKVHAFYIYPEFIHNLAINNLLQKQIKFLKKLMAMRELFILLTGP